MGAAYNELLTDEDLLRFQLQMYASCGRPRHPRARRASSSATSSTRSASAPAPTRSELFGFFSYGMLSTSLTTLRLRRRSAWRPSSYA